MAILKAGLVGTGYWGKNVGRALIESDFFSLSAICDRDDASLKKAIFKGIPSFASAAQMMDDVEIDMLFVTTNQSSHFDLALEALKRNINVFVSKPLATNTEEAKLLVTEAKKRKLLLHEDLTWLYNDSVRELKRYLRRSNAKISFIKSMRANTGPIRLDLSVLWDLAPHDVSIFNYLLDSLPLKVSAIPGANLFGGSCNVAFVSLLYPNNILINIELNSLATRKCREITVQTDKGQIIFDHELRAINMTVSEEPEENLPGLSLQLKITEPELIVHEQREALLNECKEIASAVNFKNQTLSSGNSVTAITYICELLEDSLRNKGEWKDVKCEFV